MVRTDKRGTTVFRSRLKLFTGLLTSLIFLLPYERIPSIPVLVFGASIDLRLSFFVAIALSLLVAWSITFSSSRLTIKLHTYHYWLMSFFFVYLLSALLSTDLKRALMVWTFTAFTAVTGLAVSFIWQHRDSVAIRKGLWITTWIVLIFGFYQYFGDVMGLSTNWTGLRELYTKQIFGFPRIQSTGLEPLFYGSFLLIPFFYFSSRFLSSREERPIFLVAIIVQLVLTVSRGALIGGVCGLLLLLGLYARRSLIQQKVGLVGIVILGGALALLLTNVNNIKLFGGSSDQTHGTAAPTAVIDQATNFNAQDDRVRNRTLAWEAFQDHPWLGIGPGNFSDYAKERYDGYQSISGAIVVNNEPMELLAESGLLGLLTFFGFVVIVFSALLRIVLEGGDNLSDWSYSLLAYFIALAIQYQTFSTLYIVHVWVTLGIAMGIVSMSSRTIKTSEKKKLPLQYPENLSS